LRRLPPEVGRPDDLVAFYAKGRWQQVAPWEGFLNPLSEGKLPKLVGYAGVVLKTYTRLVDRLPYDTLDIAF